jgi:amino acid transporter
VIGWQAAFASASFIAGTQIQGAVLLSHSNYDAQPWHGTLIMWAAVVLALGVNVAGGKLLPRLETVILVIHILGFFGILIPLTYMADHKSKHDVFLDFVNDGGFPTQGLSWFVGMTGCVFAFAGGDAAVHVWAPTLLFLKEDMVYQILTKCTHRWPRKCAMRPWQSRARSCFRSSSTDRSDSAC